MNELTLPAGRRRTQDVTLTGLITTARAHVSTAIAAATGWLRCNAAPLNILRAIFSGRASMVIITVCMLTLWFHCLTIDECDAQATAVGRDMAVALPWITVWAIRSYTCDEEGGEQ